MVPHSVLGSSVDSSPYPEVPLMGGGIILFSRDTLTSEEIFDALLHASDQQISNVPPIIHNRMSYLSGLGMRPVPVGA